MTKAGLSEFLYTSKDLIKTGEKLGAGDSKMTNPERKKKITVPAPEELSLTGYKEEER